MFGALRPRAALHLRPGEFTCVVGPSSCGKSALLRSMTGVGCVLLTPGSGLDPHLTVTQNLTSALRMKRVGRREAQRLAREYLNQVGLEGFEHGLPHELPERVRGRVSLARALALDPVALLLDDPFALLDTAARVDLHYLLKRLWTRTQRTVVLATSDLREALALGERVVVMENGRIVDDVLVPRSPPPRLERAAPLVAPQ